MRRLLACHGLRPLESRRCDSAQCGDDSSVSAVTARPGRAENAADPGGSDGVSPMDPKGNRVGSPSDGDPQNRNREPKANPLGPPLLLHCHNATHVPFTGVIDHEPFLALLHDQRGDERRQLAGLQEIVRVSRTMRAAARDHFEMGTRERLVHEHTSRFQQLGECLEQRSIEKADADDRIERVPCERQRVCVRHDADYSLVSSGRGGHRAVDEVHQDDRSTGARDGFGVTASASSHIEDERVDGQAGAAFDHPARWGAVRLATTLAVPCIPSIALSARIRTSAH